ncbi:MAG: hypothetical protein AAFY55_10465 [Bacteroidota bacterium]
MPIRVYAGSAPVGHRIAEDEALFACHAGRDKLEHPEKHGYQRDLHFLGERLSRGRDAVGDGMHEFAAHRHRHAGPRQVGGQRQGELDPVQRVLPERRLLFYHVGGESPVFPGRVVIELDSKRREPHPSPSAERVVDGAQLAQEELLRGMVEGQVMEDREEHPGGGSYAKERRPHRRLRGKLEGPFELYSNVLLHRCVYVRRVYVLTVAREVDAGERHRARRVNGEVRDVPVGDDRSPEDVVALLDGSHATLQHVRVQRPFDAEGRQHVVARIVWTQQFPKPDALLPGRQRHRTRGGPARNL